MCLFKDFPHNRSVYPFLMPGKRLECTCILYWLQFNTLKYKNQLDLIYGYDTNYKDETYQKIYLFCNSSFDSSKCHLEQRFKMCSNQSLYESDDSHKFS